jgi:hypothetical protein
MRLVKILGVALVAVFAFSAMAAAGASAHVFETSAAKLKLLASADGPQLFITLAGHLVCNKLLGNGVVEAVSTETQKVTVLYEDCTVSALGLTTKPDEPIEAEYEFNANGTVKILQDITILASFVGVKCTILVLPSGALSTIKYDNINSSTEILLLSHVQEILTDATGAGCAKQYKNERDALYRGNAFVKVDGGTTKWV